MNGNGGPIEPRHRCERGVVAIGLVALLAGELVALTVRFDTATLEKASGWWADILRQAPALLRIAVAAAAAVCLFAAAELRETFAHAFRDAGTRYRWRLPSFVAHLGSFAAFAWLTGCLFDKDCDPAWKPWLFVAWLAVGIAVLGTWGATLLPPQAWSRLARKRLGMLLGAAAVGAVAWMTGNAVLTLWIPLGRWTFGAVALLLRQVTGDVVCAWDRFELGTSSFSVCVAPQCSGYEGIGLIWIFLGAYLWFCRPRLRFPNALILLPLATLIMWLANVVRIACLVAIGTWVSRDVALGGFHSQAGWLAFNGIALGTVALTSRLQFFTSTAHQRQASAARNPAAKCLVPFLAVVATTMLTAAFRGSAGFDPFYPLRVAAAVGALWYFRKSYDRPAWSWTWQPVGIGVLVAVAWVILASVFTGAAARNAGGSILIGVQRLPIPVAAGWFFFRVAGYVITVPVVEELAFRGYLTRRLISADTEAVPLGEFSWFSFLVSSVLFGLLHGRHWVGGTVAGALFAVALYRRRRLGDAVVAHATTNAVIAVFATVTGNWGWWS